MLEAAGRTAALKEIAPSGAVLREQSLVRPMRGMLQVGESLLGLAETEVVNLSGGQAEPIVPVIRSPYRASKVPDDRGVVVTSLSQPQMVLIHSNLKASPSISLHAPELAAETARDAASSMTIYSVAATSDGNLVCAVSPYPSGSAILLVFGLDGTLKHRLRAVLPTAAAATDGLPASQIAVQGRDLFILSAPHGRVARYLLPK